jgi:hypothetical protein
VTPPDKNNEPLDAILRHAMRAQPGPATPECADAESMAAYSDRSLAAAERERLETHFADCMRCQVMLADIARAEESAPDVKAASEVPWYRRWRIAIPALAAVAAVLVFIAIRRPVSEEPQRDQLAAIEKREAPAMELAESAPAPPAQLVTPASPAAAPFVAPAAAPSVIAMNEVRSAARAKREAPAIKLAAPAPAPVLAPVSPAAAPPSAPAPPAPSVLAMNEAKTETLPRAEAMGAFSSQSLHRQATAPGAMSALTGAPGASGGAAIGGEVLVTIYPPDRSVSWIVGKNGMVQRRDADGTSHMQHSGVSTDLVAGASPSSRVCWMVGRSGTIIRTTDGEHWELIGAPTTENLTAVSASSAHDVAITTASGQSFTTSDGGVTWRQQ